MSVPAHGTSALIEVTQEDIDNGMKHDPNSCPVALALRRHFQTEHVNVSSGSIWVNGKLIPIPREVESFVYAFDWMYEGARVTVRPFTFTLTL